MTNEISKEKKEQEQRHYESCEKFIKRACDFYVNDIEAAKKFIIEKQPFRYCILNCYGAFIKSQELTSFEKLEPSVKTEIIDRSYEWVPKQDSENNSANLSDLRRAICCSIWTLNFALNKYFT